MLKKIRFVPSEESLSFIRSLMGSQGKGAAPAAQPSPAPKK
jgi:hypothetical protein